MSDTLVIPGPRMFVDYLAALPSEHVCGLRQAMCNCPVSEWLRTVFPRTSSITVDIDTIELFTFDDRKEIETPTWVVLFVQAIDQGQGGTHLGNVTAGEALETMQYVMGMVTGWPTKNFS